MAHNQARHRENERLEGAKGVVSGHTYSSAAAENVMDHLFDAVDVRNAGDVNFYEFASALSVSWRDPENMVYYYCKRRCVFPRIMYHWCWKTVRGIAERE